MKLLIAILVLAALLRLSFLGSNPAGFTADEAQQGYSAYSILKTGHDEWGDFLPIFPRSFGDYKAPLQTYLMVPTVGIFGLSIESTRLPSAILGVLTILVVFFLTTELLGRRKIGFWAAFLLVINPWAIQLSRTAFEGGVGVFFFSLGLLFFLKGLNTSKYFIYSSLIWGLTFYSYHSFRVFLVLFIIGLFTIYRKKIIPKKLTKKEMPFILSAVILVIFMLPLLFNLDQILARSADVGIISPQVLADYFKNRTGSILGVVDKLFDNKFLYIVNVFTSNYLSYYSPSFFFTGDRPDNSYLNFPFFPLLYPLEIIFWIVAGWVIFTGKVGGRKIIVLWLILAAIPAAFATGSMNAGRTPTFLPLTAIISAIGVSYIISIWRFSKIIIVVLLSISLLFFLHFYFIKLPQLPIDNLRYGYKEVFQKVLILAPNYNQIVISKAFSMPQIFIAFYGQYDPFEYQKASRDWIRYEQYDLKYMDQLESWNLDNFYFEDISWAKKDSVKEKALVISHPQDFPESVESLMDVRKPNGQIIYRIIPTRPSYD